MSTSVTRLSFYFSTDYWDHSSCGRTAKILWCFPLPMIPVNPIFNSQLIHYVWRFWLWNSIFLMNLSRDEAQTELNHLIHIIHAGLHDVCEVWKFIGNYLWSAVWNKGLFYDQNLFHLPLKVKISALDHEVFSCYPHFWWSYDFQLYGLVVLGHSWCWYLD